MMTPRWPGALWPATSFIGRLPDHQRDQLLRLRWRPIDFHDRQEVLREGDRQQHLLLIGSGKAAVLAAYAAGSPCLLGLRGRGDLIGEMSFLDGESRSATVVARGRMRAFCIDHHAFNGLLRRQPELGRELARLVVARLREADRRWVDSRHEILTRVARHLITLSDKASGFGGEVVEVVITQRELATKMGVAPVSVHRSLRVLSTRGYIATRHGRIVILLFDSLFDFAYGAR